MKRLFLAAGVAALAIAAPVSAKPDKGGDGNGRGERAAKVERGKGGGNARVKAERRGGDRVRQQRAERRGGDRARQQRVERRGGGERRFAVMRSERSERQQRRVEQRQERRQAAARAERRQERAERRDRREARANFERRQERAERRNDRRIDRVREARSERRNDRREAFARFDRREDRRDARRDTLRALDRMGIVASRRDRDDRFVRSLFERGYPAGLINGCPPGLATKNEFCMPPGQYRKQFLGQRLASFGDFYPVPLALRDLYRETDDYYWRYNDGYLYRVDRRNDLIRALLPLFGGGAVIGQRFPYGYDSPAYFVPSYYQSFYRDSGDDFYRYANGYVYEIDRRTGLIEDIIPLYDHGYGIGQMLPASYSYYNLPYAYRSYYVDDDEYYYRYAPGAIYRVDRDTQLITAIVSLLTGGANGFAVGQQLPAGYGVYNVPYAYRDTYYDTPDSWYRYANGSIYRVDPATQLVTAVVSLLTGGLGVGSQFPYSYSSPNYYMPAYYQPFYPDTADDYYRYANGYAYEIDRGSGIIEDVIPLYDGGYGVGQVLPASYSYYNVPDPYRSWYVDDDDYYYRYAPGAIYQVDRDTRTITSVASLLTGTNGLAVGQPLPVGYSAYNVPYDYRDRYYDTSNAWYRYANGYIYQVDPTTRLITAIISAIA